MSRADPRSRAVARARPSARIAPRAAAGAVALLALAVATGRAGRDRALAQGGAPPVASPPVAGAPPPAAAPDAARGMALFAAHCAGCHGPAGRGDGPLVDRLPAAPPDLSGPGRGDVAAAEDYATITAGRMARMMPPFAESLDDGARWDLAVAVRGLVDTPHVRARGRALWTAQCAACHGPGGAPSAAPGTVAVPPAAWLAAGNAALDARLAADAAHAAAWAELLPAARDEVLAFGRAAAFVAPSIDDLSPDGVVAGAVRDATAGGAPAAGAAVRLAPVGGALPEAPLTLTVGADGGFRRDDLVAAPPPGAAYRVSVIYRGAVFDDGRVITRTTVTASSSDAAAAAGADEGEAAPLALTVWDPSPEVALTAPELHTVLASTDESGVVEVVERWRLRNDTDRAAAEVRLPLPRGAQAVRLVAPAAAAATVDDALVLPRAVVPGEDEIVLAYALTYVGAALSLERDVTLPIAAASLTTVDGRLEVRSPTYGPGAAVSVGDLAGARHIAGPQAPGDRLVAQVSGLPPHAASAQDVLAAAPPPPVAAGALAALALGACAAATLYVAWFARAGGEAAAGAPRPAPDSGAARDP